MTSVPSAPGAHAAILEWDHRQNDWDGWESEYVRIKIFDRDGARMADIQLPFVEGFSRIKRLEARTIHADGKIIPFDGKAYDKLIAKRSRLRIMARTFSLPDVEPGSIIEYYYRREANVSRRGSTHWVLQKDLPVLKESIWFEPRHDSKSFFVTSGLKGKTLQEKDGHYELTLEDVPAYEGEPFAPPERHTKPRVDFFYSRSQFDDATKYWAAVALDTPPLIEATLSDSRLIRKTAQELVEGAATPDEKLRRIYARVQQLHNISYDVEKSEKEESKSKYTPNRNVDDALIKGYGSLSDVTRLFVSLARAAGFDANVVFAAPRDEAFFARQVPDATQLDHELASVTIDGKDLFLDPGSVLTPYGALPWEITGVPAMKFTNKLGTFVQLPHQKPDDAVIRRKADLHLDNGVVKGTVKVTYVGQEALQVRREGYDDDEQTNRKSLEDAMKESLPDGSIVKLKSLGALKSSDQPLTAEFDVELPNLGSVAGSRILMPLSIFTVAAKNPFQSKTRKFDVYFEYEHSADDEIVLAIPAGYSIESLPAGSDSNLGGLAYKNTWTRDDRAVTFHRSFTLNTLLIAKTNYEWVRRLYESSLAADQETVVFKQ